MKGTLMEITCNCEFLSEEDIEKGRKSKKIQDIAIIKHDKDVYSDEEIAKSKLLQEKGVQAGDLKAPHWHIMIRTSYSVDFSYIAKDFNTKENNVNKSQTGKYVDMLLYLIHANAPHKHQYDISEVDANFNYKEAVETELKKRERKEKTDFKKQAKSDRLFEIIEQIENGIIKPYNYTDYVDMKEYAFFKRYIDTAFNYRTDKLLRNPNRKMDCIFIQGDSGFGKTTFGKKIAEDKGYDVYISASGNDILDNYRGQDCIILDDLRPSTMCVADLLKLTDNHTACAVKSRYKNKCLECKLLIITSVLDITTFFNNVFSEQKETAIQLYRRCRMNIVFSKEKLDISLYNPVKRCYEHHGVLDNPYSFLAVEMTEEEKENYCLQLLGTCANDILLDKDNEEYKDSDKMNSCKDNEEKKEEDPFGLKSTDYKKVLLVKK